MVKTLKTLIFSMTFLTYSAFSSHAMFFEDDPFADIEADAIRNAHIAPVPTTLMDDSEEKERVYAFCNKYQFSDGFTRDVYHEVKGKAFQLNEYGVSNLDYTAALLFYNKRRVSTEFGLLFDLFTKTPPENRKKIWENLVSFEAYRSTDPALYEFSYDSVGKVHISPYKLEGTVSLKEKLFSLPQK